MKLFGDWSIHFGAIFADMNRLNFHEPLLRFPVVKHDKGARYVDIEAICRGGRMQPRDPFVVPATAECGQGPCSDARSAFNAMPPAFTQSIVGQLMVRDKNLHLIANAHPMTRRLLRAALDTTAH